MTDVRASFVNDRHDVAQTGSVNGVACGRIEIERTFTGGLEGSSTAELHTARSPDGSAAYVGFDWITATIAGRHGSFVLQQWGVLENGERRVEGAIVPGSGTQELAGIRGTATIHLDAAGDNILELDYDLP